MKNNKRVKDEKVTLDIEKLRQFFDSRGDKIDNEFPYTSVLYQDENPNIAYKRDVYEKTKISPLLGICENSRVLDIGCGIGRWGDEFVDKVEHYIGVDFSESLIEQARRRFNSEKFTFKVLSADEVCRETVASTKPVDVIIISGVLLYLNDQQVVNCFNGLSGLASNNPTIYIREPLGINGRLTLDGYWSDELSAEYCAIYRTANDLTNLISLGWGEIKKSIEFIRLYDDESLNNRAETAQFYSICQLA